MSRVNESLSSTDFPRTTDCNDSSAQFIVSKSATNDSTARLIVRNPMTNDSSARLIGPKSPRLMTHWLDSLFDISRLRLVGSMHLFFHLRLELEL